MSGEFGTYEEGYFWYKADSMADDAEAGGYEITRQWGKLLRAFAPVARAIAWAEARDSSEAYAITESWAHLPEVEKALREIAAYLAPYQAVARRAVEEHIKQQS